MNTTPAILLNFANDQDAYLQQLKIESSRINQALSPLEDRGALRLFREESAQTEDIIQACNRFAGHIIGFHYGGHAHGKGIGLEDQQGHAAGLAQLLGREPQLHFVFLNGCATQGQVKGLLQAGVPVVIATSVPIEDQRATQFAGYFYEKLANQGSLQQAFTFASDSLSLQDEHFKGADIQAVPVSRNLAFAEEVESTALPWKLYFDESRPELLDWCLPLPPNPSSSRPHTGEDYEVNEFLYAILEEMAAYDANIDEELERMEDEREYFEMIIKNFPWNIGSQFGLLVGEKQANRNRLEQIISTYMACGQWLYFVPLSQLWKARFEKRITVFQGPPQQVFTLTADNCAVYDYIQAFHRIMGELQQQEIEPFISEFNSLQSSLQKGGDLYDAYLFLESVRAQLMQQPKETLATDMLRLCADAEYALSAFLCRLTFLVKYQMVTVRDISVFNPRHLNTKYHHKIGRLNAHTDERLFFFRKAKEYDGILESDSVLLLKDPDDIENYLNLSPFFIDRNAYRDKSAELTDLYTYGYAQRDYTNFFYLKSSRNMLSALQNNLDQLSTNEEVVSDVRRRGARGLKNRPRRHTQEQRPYALLHDQFKQLIDLLQ